MSHRVLGLEDSDFIKQLTLDVIEQATRMGSMMGDLRFTTVHLHRLHGDRHGGHRECKWVVCAVVSGLHGGSLLYTRVYTALHGCSTRPFVYLH